MQGDWQTREQELLKKIEELEQVKNERSEDAIKLQLKVSGIFAQCSTLINLENKVSFPYNTCDLLTNVTYYKYLHLFLSRFVKKK